MRRVTGALHPQDAAAVEQVVARVREVYGRWRRDTPAQEMRDDWNALFAAPQADASVTPVEAGGRPAAWISGPGVCEGCAVLHLHGGGFKVGSIRSHTGLMAALSEASGCPVLGLDYRLAPEHVFPAAVEDALGAYRWLLDQGFPAERIAVSGDSAGAGLAVSLLLAAREAGLPAPACGVLMSAWTDLTAQGESYQSRAADDPIHQRGMILAMARSYLGPGGDATSPLASPLFGDLAGLPPLLLQVGARETVVSDSTAFARKARRAGVEVELELWPGMIHVFQQFSAELHAAREAVARCGCFVRAHLAPTPAEATAP